MRQSFCVAFSIVTMAALMGGCASKAPLPSGFLSDYSRLKAQGGALRYVGPELTSYSAFMIDPVQMRASKQSLKPNEAAEVARYFNDTLAKELTKRGFQVVDQPDAGVGRIRVALTDIQESKWYLNLHPASKVSGVGKGGASMEGEIIDAVTGNQLAAVIQAGKGNQFELDTFSKLDDVKDTIDQWAKNAGDRLDQLRRGSGN